MQLTVQYSAPLPPGFLSGSLTLTSKTTYIDKNGLVNQPVYRAIINSDRGLSNVQAPAQQLQIIGMGLGDPATASPLVVTVTMTVTGQATPLKYTFSVIPLDTGGGNLNLHLPAINVPLVGPLPDTIQALIAQVTAAQAILSDLVTQSGTNLALITFVLASYPQVVQQAQAVLQAVYDNAALLPNAVVADYTARDAYFAALNGDGTVTTMNDHLVWQRKGGIISNLGPNSLAYPTDAPNIRPLEISSKPRPLRGPRLTFRFDDGFINDSQDVRPILLELGINATFCIVNSYVGQTLDTVPYMTWDQIRQLQADGNEIASHTFHHVNLTTLNAADLDAELASGVAGLKAQGLNVNILAYPLNAHNAQVRKGARKQVRGALAGGYTSAVPPLDTYALPFREFVPNAPLSLYTGWIDEAIASNGICCVLIHSRFPEFDAGQKQNFRDMIAYARSHGVEIVTASQALERDGNQMEFGDPTGGVAGFGVDRDGKPFGTGIGTLQQAAPNFKTAAAGLQEFDAGKITVFDVNPQTGANWPIAAGTITVNRLASASGHLSTPGGGNFGWEFQQAKDYYTDAVYERRATGLTTWTDWTSAQAVYVRLPQNGGSVTPLSSSSPRTAYPASKISTMDAYGNGWPYSACSVITDRTAGGDASGSNTMWDRQFCYDFYSEAFSIRRALSDSAWSAWTEVSNPVKILPQNANNVSANSARTFFANGRITTMPFYNGLALGFPCSVGQLYVYRLSPDAATNANASWDREEVEDYNSNATWKRRATSDTAWTIWERTDAGAVVVPPPQLVQDTTYRASTPITAFPAGKTIYTQLNPSDIAADSTGVYPPGASGAGGTLVTETITTANGSTRAWSKQYFWINGFSTIFYRGLNNVGNGAVAWGDWYLLSRGVYTGDQTLNFGNVPAGGEATLTITVPGAIAGDLITATRRVPWFAGLHLMRATCYLPDGQTQTVVQLVARNFTASAIADANEVWTIRATR